MGDLGLVSGNLLCSSLHWHNARGQMESIAKIFFVLWNVVFKPYPVLLVWDC